MSPRPHLAHWPARLPQELEVPETPLWFNLEVAARRYPRKAAYLYLGRKFTWQDLHRQAEALAGWLQASGVQTGDRVLLYMQNCPQYVVAAFAVLRANAVIVPVNPMNRADEFGHYITDPEARVAIVSADLAAVVAEADARLPAGQRLQHVLVTRYADAMPAEAELDPA
ncbi:MAG: AMP-binding protein, partial [Rubrivivax sp.]